MNFMYHSNFEIITFGDSFLVNRKNHMKLAILLKIRIELPFTIDLYSLILTQRPSVKLKNILNKFDEGYT